MRRILMITYEKSDKGRPIMYVEESGLLSTIASKMFTITGKKAERLYKELTGQALKQEPKTGHWRAIYQGDEIIDYRCSECEFGNTFGKSTWGMNYCPYCGAKMESEEKHDTDK